MRNYFARHLGIAAAMLATLSVAASASAQMVQSVQVGVGGVFPKGFDGRAQGDVLVRNATGEVLPGFRTLSDALLFEMRDFRSGHVFGEWNVSFGPHIEVSAGLGFYNRSVPTIYADLVDDNDREIEQTLRLRVIPATAIVRFLPVGRASDVQPYLGVGIAALNFRYSEAGSFVDPDTLDIFNDRFVAKGTVPAGILLGGVRVPLGGDVYGFFMEGRYQFGTGETGGFGNGFLDEKIDLSGGQFNVGMIVRF